MTKEYPFFPLFLACFHFDHVQNWHDERRMNKGWEKKIDFSSRKQNQSAQMTHVGSFDFIVQVERETWVWIPPRIQRSRRRCLSSSPFPPCSWANWDHASLRDANRMWALKWSGLPHRVIISSLVFSAKEWIQGCMRLLCATEPHPRASVTSQPSTPPPLYYLSFRTWVTAMGVLISCRILHVLCVVATVITLLPQTMN